MNLILDLGNTNLKIAIIDDNQIVFTETKDCLEKSYLDKILKKHSFIDKAIVSSVRNDDFEIIEFLRKELSFFIEFNYKTQIPIKNLYKSPESLGCDRIANVSAVNYLQPNKDILVIDAGTAITYDFINANGEFTGGDITPGANMRANALNRYTSRLPRVDLYDEPVLMANSTEDAIISGIINGICFEMDGYIRNLTQKHPDILIFLTGGDINFFDKKLKNHIFVNPYLNFIGLNRILNFNAGQEKSKNDN